VPHEFNMPDSLLIEPDSINKNYIDSSDISRFFLEFPRLKKQEDRVLKFYEKRNFQYAWFDNHGLIEQAHLFVNLAANYNAEGVDDTIVYDTLLSRWHEYYDDSTVIIDSFSAKMELMLTSQFFQYAQRIWGGISEKQSRDLDWYIKRKRLPYVTMLDSMLINPNFFAEQTPVFKQYDSLKNWLQYYQSIEAVAKWDSIFPEKKKYQNGDTSKVILQIRKRLYWLRDLPAEDTAGNRFDSALVDAVKKFQQTHGLADDGAIGPQTIDRLNIPLANRIEEIMINMERCRWVPIQPHDEYITVNIPEYLMRVYDHDTLAWSCNVVVGETTRQTVIFNGNLRYVVFSPYWVIPPGILQNEILPACRKDPNYIHKQNMEVVEAGGAIVDPKDIDWRKYSAKNFPYKIRQKPGASNSLGKVKFLFPNEYDIYLHDTPAKGLFSRNKRNFSHGCIRVSEPMKLSEFLLRTDSSWTEDRIKAAMNAGKEQYVTLKKPVPVFIGYLTCFVDSKGRLNFRDDVYGHDKRLAETLFTNPSL